MALNITQDMCFETDHLESFQTMLLAAVQTMFRPGCGDKPVGKKQPMYLERNAPSYWPDGSESSFQNQPSFLNDGKDCRVLTTARCYGGAVQMKFDSPPLDIEEAARECSKRGKARAPTRRWVTTLRDEAYNEKNRPTKDKIRCRGPEDAVAKAMVFLRQDENVDLQGIRNVHAGGDGSHGLAYRMDGRGWGSTATIYISSTWAYYGK
jgi:hypothetical protein